MKKNETKQMLNYSRCQNFDWMKQEMRNRTRVISRNAKRPDRGVFEYIRSLLF